MGKFISILAVGVVFVGGAWYFMSGAPSANAKKQAEIVDYYSNVQIPGQTDSTQAASAAAPQLPSVTNTLNGQANNQQKIMNATFHTNQGDITIEFMESDAPNTVANFVKLAKEGFYDGTKFHRVIQGFMIQGGDPLTKDDSRMSEWGTGGPGYKFNDEIRANNQNNVGTISMANAGPNTNGSQFFINVANNNFLNQKHTVFGRVTSGMDVVTKIENVETNANDRPLEAIVIESVTLN